MTLNGMLAVDTKIGTVDGHTFFDFIRGTVISNMMPFNETNPNSVVIMDNCSIHHNSEVKDLLCQAGILVLFIPPYTVLT